MVDYNGLINLTASHRPMDANSIALAPDEDVRVQKLSHAVADRLRAQIVSGQRKAGEKLPLESELVTQFKVSRPTIREALRILEVESLITLGRGARAGATVHGPTVERAAEYAAMVLSSAGTTIGELHGARTVIEPSMVMQLAKKKDRKLLDELQAYAQAGLEAISKSDYVEANACMAKFHAALVRASDNRALILIVEMLTVLQRQTLDLAIETAAGEHASLRAQQPKALQSYLQLVELMRQGKAEEAQTFWRKYMERMHAFLEKSGLQARRIRHG